MNMCIYIYTYCFCALLYTQPTNNDGTLTSKTAVANQPRRLVVGTCEYTGYAQANYNPFPPILTTPKQNHGLVNFHIIGAIYGVLNIRVMGLLNHIKPYQTIVDGILPRGQK